jgi:hypothetical protein
MTTTLELHKNVTAIEPTYTVSYGISEDAIRASLIEAVKVMNGVLVNSIFDMTETGKQFMFHAQQYLEDELDAHLRGTFAELEKKRRAAAARR